MAVLGSFDAVLEFIRKHADKTFVRAQLERAGLTVADIRTYDDFRKLKPLKKQELSVWQSGLAQATALYDGVTKVFQSPGPVYNVKGAMFEHYRFYKGLQEAGFTAGDVVLNTFAYHMTPAGEMFDEAALKLGCTVVPMGPADTAKGAEMVKASGATAFVGTKTYLMKVLDALGGANTVKKAYCIAEKLTQADREFLQNTWGVDVYQGYGTAELGLIATETADKDGMQVDTAVHFIEILDPATGEPAADGQRGEAVVTFLSETTPFLRLSTGDVSCTMPTKPGYIEGIFGRVDASAKVKGCFVHFWQMEELFKNMDGFGKLVITADDKHTDHITLTTNVSPCDQVVEAFRKTFGLRLNEVLFDDTVQNTEIVDERTHLKEK